MDAEIKELIQLSTQNGTLAQDARDLIYRKAAQKGISSSECDVYINGYLTSKVNHNVAVQTHNRNWGIWLIIVGVLDILWGINLANKPFGDDAGAICVLSGLVFLIIGAYKAGGKNSKKYFIRAFYLIIPLVGAHYIALLFSKPFDFLNLWTIEEWVYDIGYLVFFVGLVYIFRYKILGAEYGRTVSHEKADGVIDPLLNKLPPSAVNFLKSE